jgi:hypothetical protein
VNRTLTVVAIILGILLIIAVTLYLVGRYA